MPAIVTDETRQPGQDAAAGVAPAELADPAFLEELRAQMLRFAALQLSDDQLAEDAVQEALAGALRNADTFARRAALKSWVFAILKNKIADLLRQRQRMPDAVPFTEENDDDTLDALFDRTGHWEQGERPAPWPRPEESMTNEQFWRVFDACLDNLPERLARIFMMREFLGMGSREICTELSISVSNHHVMLHRARLRLRRCLENGWFDEDSQR